MKKLLSFLFILLLTSCITNSQDRTIEVDAADWDYYKYNNSVVDFIHYCDGCGGSSDYITIYFKDGMKLQISAYKYNMKIVL